MEPGLTQIYQDLGYLPPDTDFNMGKYGKKTYEDAIWEEFDQLEFIKYDGKSDGMLALLETEFYPTGWVYIPNSCKKEKCRVHVALHGCGSNGEELQMYSQYN